MKNVNSSYYARNKEKFKERYAKKRSEILLTAKNHYAENKDKKLEYAKEYYQRNKIKIRKDQAKYYEKKPEKRRAIALKRRSTKLKCTPSWLTVDQFEEIEMLYTAAKLFRMYTGGLYHVDHIVPLKHKLVCGLHVPWNMQVLPASENMSKKNKFEVS